MIVQIGRTGRFGRFGISFALVGNDIDYDILKAIDNFYSPEREMIKECSVDRIGLLADHLRY